MDRKRLLPVSLLVALAVAGSAGLAAAQDDEREPGPPSWAGPPSGPDHPGYAGRLEGQARSEAGSLNRDPLAGPPGLIGSGHPGYAGWQFGQDTAAREGDNRDPLAGPPWDILGHPGYAGWLMGQNAKAAAEARSGAATEAGEEVEPEEFEPPEVEPEEVEVEDEG